MVLFTLFMGFIPLFLPYSMHSLTPDYLTNLRLNMQQSAMLRTLGAYQGKQQLYVQQQPEVLQGLKNVAAVESIESSNRLEGVEIAPRRLKPLVLKNATPQNRSEQEVAGYRDALVLIHENKQHMPITASVLQQIHSTLYRYMPQTGGRWKATNNDIIERHADGSTRVRFCPVAAHLTPQAMADWANHYHYAINQQLADALVIVPLTVLDFLCIHPFTDGNGRIARLLTLQLLYHFDYIVGQFISLERIVEESKGDYYDTLEASSQGWHEGVHNAAPWLDYFWATLLRAYKEFEERVGTVQHGRGAKTQRVRTEILKRHTPFAISELEADCHGISRDTVRLVLRAMQTEGVIASTGKGRGARWQRIGLCRDSLNIQKIHKKPK